MTPSPRWLPFVLLMVAVTVATDAPRAQTSDAEGTSDRVTTVPLPNGEGVFYYRAGTPGGVRIRSRNGDAPRSASAFAEDDLSDEALVRELETAARSDEPLTRADLLRLELALRRDLDSKISQLIPFLLDRGRDGGTTFLPSGSRSSLVPGQAPPTIIRQQRRQDGTLVPDAFQPGIAPPALGPAGRADVPPVSTGPATVEEVERAILETGLFRTTTVNFEFDESDLLPTARRTLDIVGNVLARYPDLLIGIAGHTDNIGSDAYNQRLSQRRAEAVRAYLLGAFDIDPTRLEARGYGESQPVVPNSNPTTRTLNRRVEFVVLNPDAAEQYRIAPTDREALRRQLRGLFEEELQRMNAAPADSSGG